MAPQNTKDPSLKNIANKKVNNVKSTTKKDSHESKIQNTWLGFLLRKLFFWGETYNSELNAVWNQLPQWTAKSIVFIATFLLGITARGEWILFGVYFYKYAQSGGSDSYKDEANDLVNSWSDNFQSLFKGFLPTLFYSVVVSYLVYFGIGGFLHWYYYVRQKDNPEAWKCQPKQWLSSELEMHEIKWGSIGLLCGSTLSAITSTYILNGGWTRMYFRADEYGYLWLAIQLPVVFIWNDYLTYWHHRMYHTPYLYKNFHKLHHTYKQPTAFSVTAIHPVEFIHMQLVLISPIFIFPTYWLNYVVILAYTYYHGIIDHSGINFKRHWWQPWQPDCIFHDNHHQYFHVNFGFNIEFWDRLHGTYRRADRIYREDIYYGYGKSVDEASKEELQKDLEERKSENPKAYPKGVYGYDLKR